MISTSKKTFGLTMIVGPNDADDLRRCLSSFPAREIFNQICLVYTTSDEAVVKACKELGDVTAYFPWTSERYPHGNFGGARNAAVELCTTDYWMWLDCDDIFYPDSVKAFEDTLRIINRYDFDILVNRYVLSEVDGKPRHTLSRERIVKRSSGICWKFPVHEQLTCTAESRVNADLRGLDVIHRPTKPYAVSSARNLQILEHEFFRRNCPKHFKYYYARDLISAGLRLAAIPILVGYIDSSLGDDINLYESACELVNHYLYDGDSIRNETVPLAEKYVRIALQCHPEMAEPYVYLGDIFLSRGELRLAEHQYKAAMQKTFGSGRMQDVRYYEEIPAVRLTELNSQLGRNEEVLWYSKIAMEHGQRAESVLSARKKAIEELVKELV